MSNRTTCVELNWMSITAPRTVFRATEADVWESGIGGVHVQLDKRIGIDHCKIDTHSFVPISQSNDNGQHCSFTDSRCLDTHRRLRSAVTQVSDHPGFITILHQTLIPVSLLSWPRLITNWHSFVCTHIHAFSHSHEICLPVICRCLSLCHGDSVGHQSKLWHSAHSGLFLGHH